ncbi:MAG: holo-ACP synthase [Simkaniaceae bacterium]|nr:holo-ACP synthase [Simkaniaceae bacterium]
MKNSNLGPIGLGTDIIEISRIRDSIEEFEDKFLDRLFTPKEKEYCERHRDPAIRYAGRFAAKEAISKALGTGFGAELHWHDIEIVNDEKGKPSVHFSSSLLQNHPDLKIELSISHCHTYAVAVALRLEKAEG